MFFTILTPVKDAEQYLTPLLNSIRKQRFTDWEMIAVDDGSSDESIRVLVKLSRVEPRIRVVQNSGSGIVDALNTGLSAARGEWMVRVDSDDICHPDLLSELSHLTEAEPGTNVFGSQIRYFPRRVLGEGLTAYEEWINSLTSHHEITRDMFVECPMPHPTLTCRREELVSIGGYRDLGWPEDYDLVLRFWKRGAGFSKVCRPLYFWRDTETRLSRTDSRYSLEMFTEVKIHVLVETLLAGSMTAVVAGTGPVGKDFARRLIRRGVKIRAFLEVNPAKIGKRIYDIPVLDVREATGLRGTIILHAVGQKGTREEARRLYTELGLHETDDFLFVS